MWQVMLLDKESSDRNNYSEPEYGNSQRYDDLNESDESDAYRSGNMIVSDANVNSQQIKNNKHDKRKGYSTTDNRLPGTSAPSRCLSRNMSPMHAAGRHVYTRGYTSGHNVARSKDKTMLDYLIEAANEECSKIRRAIYTHKRSFLKSKALLAYENTSGRLSTRKSSSSQSNEAEETRVAAIKSNGKGRAPKNDSINALTLTEQDNRIESFADFADSLFPEVYKDSAKMYKCPYDGCRVTLPSLSRIKRHYLIHTNIKPFKCLSPKCDKQFSRKDNMLQHYRTHCKRGGRR